MIEQALQFGGSLAAILLLTYGVYRLRLGTAPTLETDAFAMEEARLADSGFEPVTIARSFDGTAALLMDDAGRIMLLRLHGAQWAGRLLGPNARVSRDGPTLTIHTGEAQFGAAVLTLKEPPDAARIWEQRIAALSS
ncbi:hypothetical protein HME9302_02243 [Alteripontixanthobacter maritimus]|uniref:Uncharacterized protein n=1 Tax=Alteripontixanthobacter maritimus TaxID=2161824 RepID=A0A369QCR4_9SPHN|nr:hypothetical protein [Alteripontixanthobacter maritimus]RDC61026.1 hypothetical protein HME9302_02243 [Alteripontixanthobacter maritimus]